MATEDLGFTIVTQYPTVEFLGGTQTRDVTAVGFTTNGHGVYYEARIPNAIYSPQQVFDYATGYTGTIEQVFNWNGVIGASWSQQPNANDELADFLTLTVSSTSGNSTAQITIPFTDLGVAAGVNKVTALHHNLDLTEAGP